ncbi:MAG: NapC/NirT family cytochrome c [Peptococcaceae bacterium]|nr:NapC/NirT family cytochrome c [Peptococcaceae bacterium]
MEYQRPNPEGTFPEEKKLETKEENEKNGTSEEKKKAPKSLRKRMLFIVIVLLIILVGGAFTVGVTSQSSFCKTCHVMEDFYDTWEVATHSLSKDDEVLFHKTAECLDCHGKDGFIGTVEIKMNGLRQVWVNLTDTPEPSAIKADSKDIQERCIKCHQSKPRTNLKLAAEDKDPHSQEHFNESVDMTCMTCHEGLVHKKRSADQRSADRETCFRCHLNAMDL